MPTAARPAVLTQASRKPVAPATPEGTAPAAVSLYHPTPSGAPRNRIAFALTDNTRPRSQAKEPDPAPTPTPAFREASSLRPVPGHPPHLLRSVNKTAHPDTPFARTPCIHPLSPPDAAPGTRKIPAPPAHPAGPIPRRHRRVRIQVTGRAGPAPGPRGGGLNGRSDLIAARSGTCRRCLCFGRYHYIRCVRHREDPCGIFRTVFFARPGGGSARNPAPPGPPSTRPSTRRSSPFDGRAASGVS